MFKAASFTIAKTLTQHKCPSMDEWINSVVYSYNGILFSLKREGNSDI